MATRDDGACCNDPFGMFSYLFSGTVAPMAFSKQSLEGVPPGLDLWPFIARHLPFILATMSNNSCRVACHARPWNVGDLDG